MRAVVHSEKHYFQMSIFTVVASAIAQREIIKSVAVDAKDSVSEVTEGSVIKAVYVELWVRASEVSPGSFVVTLEKLPGGMTVNMSAAQSAALGDYPNKKNILFCSQALTNDQDADAIPILRQWVKIPKSKQRFGLGDALTLNLHAIGAIDLVFCGFATYKEYN